MASSISNRLSREDYKKSKELEELRKTGAAPPELDEDGKMINPHIPQYISQAPWYLNNNRPGLKHQYLKHFGREGNFASVREHHIKGKRKASVTKWKSGSCTNCGASTHKTKFCVERPRRKGAKLTHQDIAQDEILQEVPLDYEGKRDRWNGYDPATYQRVIDHYRRTDKERRKKKGKELDQEFKGDGTRIQPETDGKEAKAKDEKEGKEDSKVAGKEKKKKDKKEKKEKKDKKKKEKKELTEEEKQAKSILGDSDTSDSDTGTDTESDTDTDVEADSDKEDLKDMGKVIQKRDARTRTTVRNLRIREDTAKYLRNLNLNSAHYDPKTRSMRGNPHPDRDPETLMYAGDNFVRRTGDVEKIAALQQFVWEAQDRGNTDVHVLSNPSQSELLFEQFKKKKEALKTSKKSTILTTYGGEEHLEVPDKHLLMAQSESYVEYSASGEVIKGQESAIPRTKYIEDVLESNHTEIWGSYWQDGKWGYACCNQCERNAYCTGETGKALTSTSTSIPAIKPPVPLFSGAIEHKEVPKEEGAKEKGKKKKRAVLEEDTTEDGMSSKKLKEALKKEKEHQQSGGELEKNRSGYNKLARDTTPSAEEMEAYHRLRPHKDDPMASYVDEG